MSEIWADIPGYPGYEVSSEGRVRSWRRYRGDPGPRLMRTFKTKNGYLELSLSPGRRPGHKWSIHRLVMLAFVGPLPAGHETRHLNGDPSDNRLANLSYGTVSENHHDTVRHGRNKNAVKTHCKWGHLFNEANTYYDGRKRHCRTCGRLSARARKAAA